MYKFLCSKKGFTLVELVCVVLLLGLGVMVLGNLFRLGFRAFDKSAERYEKQETAKIVAQYLQKGGAGLGGATKVELYDNINVVPAKNTVEKGYNYLYVDPADGCLYIRPSGSKEPTQITDVGLYMRFDMIPPSVNLIHGRGVECTIAVLEDDVDIDKDEDGTIHAPKSDDIYYSLTVAYHFPNMVENDKLYVNRIMETPDNYVPATTTGSNGTTYTAVDTGASVVRYVTDLTVAGDQLMNDSNFQLYCFIATASYGVNNGEGVVGLLCDFRDKVLLTNPLGEAFVKAYYKLSPPIADVIAESEPLRAAVRVALKPLVVIAVNALDEDVARESAPWFAALMLCGAGSTAMLIRITKRRKKIKG